MARLHGEEQGIGAHRFVLLPSEPDRFDAFLAAALAEEVDPLLGSAVHLDDLLVQLPEERLVECDPPVPPVARLVTRHEARMPQETARGSAMLEAGASLTRSCRRHWASPSSSPRGTAARGSSARSRDYARSPSDRPSS